MNILSIDLGTTNIKVALTKVDGNGIRIVKSMNINVPAEKPEFRAYEHNPYIIKKLIFNSIRHFSKHENIDALVFTVYLFGLIGLNAELKPVTNIITWLDERPMVAAKHLKPYERELYVRTGCPVLHIYGLPKILWLRKYRKAIFNRIKYFLDAKSFLMLMFTGDLISDYSTVSGTYQLLNIHELKWDSYALSIAELDENMLPEIAEGLYNTEVIRNVQEKLGLPEKTPVVIGLYDSASMIYGLTLGKSGVGVINIGTSAMLRTVVDKPIIDDPKMMRFQTYYLMEKRWLSGGGINNAGVVLEYLREQLFPKESKDIFYKELLRNIEIDQGIRNKMLFIPLLYVERLPLIQSNIGGCIIGLSEKRNRIDIIRAAIEGIIFLLKIIDDGIRDNGIVCDEVVIGGKISQYSFVQKALANILGRKVIYCGVPDASHIGNALIALRSLRACGKKEIENYYESLMSKCESIFPTRNLQKHYNELYEYFKEILRKVYNVKI
ncbi:MAG: carbohydrate kinase [Desulfurococcales archaeon ex4484_217_2]|nr:MAG: carbohydrate kinase [Desulfurococcales archaeon ex4484_217_2]